MYCPNCGSADRERRDYTNTAPRDAEWNCLHEWHNAPSEDAAPRKCEHGVRIADGDTYARYCSGCSSEPLRIIAPARRVPEVKHIERTLDVVDYFESSVSERLADADRMEMMA